MELARGELDDGVAAPAPVLGGIEGEVAGNQDGRTLPTAPSHQGPNTRHQHDEGERLGQEVVCPGVERLGLIELAGLCRQHQDGDPVALGPQRGADLEPVAARQQDVEHDHVIGVLAGPPQAIGPGVDGVHREALGLEASGHRGGQVFLVLDDRLRKP